MKDRQPKTDGDLLGPTAEKATDDTRPQDEKKPSVQLRAIRTAGKTGNDL
ncbi:hypothetical protein [uncultured Bacteroides sp.]|nr:hypothetical protein [uncultured Bacteroides sp.]